MSGRRPEELAIGTVPLEAAHVWGWFLRLNSARPSGMGASAIPESEIEAFFRNRKITPMEWEIDALVALDNTALTANEE
jgi:hypothetical protein